MQAAAIPAASVAAPRGERFIVPDEEFPVSARFEALTKALEEIVPGSVATFFVHSMNSHSAMFRVQSGENTIQIVLSPLPLPHDTCVFVSNPESREDKFSIIHADALKKAGHKVVMRRSSSLGCPVLSILDRMILRVEYSEFKTPPAKQAA